MTSNVGTASRLNSVIRSVPGSIVEIVGPATPVVRVVRGGDLAPDEEAL